MLTTFRNLFSKLSTTRDYKYYVRQPQRFSTHAPWLLPGICQPQRFSAHAPRLSLAWGATDWQTPQPHIFRAEAPIKENKCSSLCRWRIQDSLSDKTWSPLEERTIKFLISALKNPGLSRRSFFRRYKVKSRWVKTECITEDENNAWTLPTKNNIRFITDTFVKAYSNKVL